MNALHMRLPSAGHVRCLTNSKHRVIAIARQPWTARKIARHFVAKAAGSEEPTPSSEVTTSYVTNEATRMAAMDSAVEAAPEPSDEMGVEDLKAALLDSLYMTERGLAPSSEARAEINELISSLEAKCPTPNPTENLDMMAGTWKLLYTYNSPLLPIIALGRLPMVTVGDITQTIDIVSLTAESKIELEVPFSKTAITASASFEVRSPKRLQLVLEKGIIKTPELLTDLEIPEYLNVMGTNIDLTQLKPALDPFNEGVKGIFSQVNDLLKSTPEVSVPLSSSGAKTWQLNTYLDADTRIARGDGGSIFLYVKETPVDVTVDMVPVEEAAVQEFA